MRDVKTNEWRSIYSSLSSYPEKTRTQVTAYNELADQGIRNLAKQIGDRKKNPIEYSNNKENMSFVSVQVNYRTICSTQKRYTLTLLISGVSGVCTG